ncbi:MAG: RNA-dependent RNA polymerase [Epicoccum nigrum mitovirus 1]|uniref:RNA-dependent RNA polymerase n=1 Tax=Epicoccum nigrum mitovirus 1 TaxID=2587536 RepID=UPI002481E494|nr:MAG: RNA-dependent RNA polymerase [Epicoccum nigrum mitovirus 1]QDB74989.1 MAG: RNA-dependent RNA polymerase [Epicoccum nigrum mitovirus 1]
MKTNVTNNSKLNLLTLLSTKYVEVSKMIPLTDKLGTTLFKPLAYNNMLAHGRVGRLAYGIRRTSAFIRFTLTMWRHHGVTFTIKWLKGCSVAIQKCLGKDILASLRVLTPDLPLNGLSRGLPRIIPVADRVRIRSGHVPTIRFWLGLFNLYRVLKAPGELKLGTITNKFTGDREGLRVLIRLSRTFNPFSAFQTKVKLSLAPDNFVMSRSASPSNKVSWFGIFTDTKLLREFHPVLWGNIQAYLTMVGADKFKFLLEHACELSDRLSSFDGDQAGFVSKSGRKLYQSDSMVSKDSIRAHGVGPGLGLSQFAIKEEAAGKLRLFALMDSITQSVMSPLHDYMFDLLRLIPNDGTFDQEASIVRSQEKAVSSGCAYSFDLTAATDRLPVVLTAFIFTTIVGIRGFGTLWRNIMVKRPFAFNATVAQKLKVSDGPYFYEVGQPMGALSSWPGLAITHHWIVQVAALRVYNSRNWCTQYEVLGDDIVIFDPAIAEEYRNIMAVLGCEINLNKSISSLTRPVFEFAKRTCWGFAIVSGISMAQIRAGWKVGGRVANALQFARAGLLETTEALLQAVLSRNTFSKGRVLPDYRTSSVTSQKALSLGVLALLGERFQSGIIPLRTVMHAIINPEIKDIGLKGNAIAIPIKASLHAAYQALVETGKPQLYPFSKEWVREPKFLEHEGNLAIHLLHSALNKVIILRDQYNWLIAKNASEMYFPLYYLDSNTEKVPLADLPGPYLALVSEIEQFFEMLIGLEMNWKDHPDAIYQDLYMEMDSTLYYEEALELHERVERLEYKLKPYEGKTKPGRTVHETAPIISALRGILGSKSRRWLNSPALVNVTTLM